MTRGLRAVLVGAAVSSLLAACGDGDLPAQRGLPANSALVSTADVVKYKPHSPQRTLMAWWRAIQYTDGRAYLSLLSEPLRERNRENRAYRTQLPVMARQLLPAQPHIKRVAVDGDSATIYVQIEFRTLVGADKFSATRFPQAFALVREGKEWRMADDLFVEAGAAPELRRQQQGDARAGVRQPQIVTVTVPATTPPPAPNTPLPAQQP